MAAHLLLTEVQRLCVSLRFSHERLSKEDKSLRHTVTSLTTQLASVTKENKDFNEIVLPGLLVSYDYPPRPPPLRIRLFFCCGRT